VPRLPRDIPRRVDAGRDDKPRARLGVVPDLAHHPLPDLIERGLFVTLKPDDPICFGGYLNENRQAVAEAFALPLQTLCTLARNSFQASFLDDVEKAEFVAGIDAYRRAILG
jgi:adenosine deaminase